MTCTAYHTAAESAKSAVISALNDNEDTNVLSELWRHYLGLRYISDNHKHKEPEAPKFSALGAEFYNTPSGDDHIKFDIEGPYAAQPVEYPFSVGQDVITFGDTHLPGGASTDTISFS